MCHSQYSNSLILIYCVSLQELPYSGYNLRGAISANHQISHLEVIFASIKFANHGVARSIYASSAYQYFDYKHRVQHEPWNLKWITTLVYQEVWSSLIGEVLVSRLVCHRDTRNHHDPLAVATCKGVLFFHSI